MIIQAKQADLIKIVKKMGYAKGHAFGNGKSLAYPNPSGFLIECKLCGYVCRTQYLPRINHLARLKITQDTLVTWECPKRRTNIIPEWGMEDY